jgi:hypothetical protein
MIDELAREKQIIISASSISCPTDKRSKGNIALAFTGLPRAESV